MPLTLQVFATEVVTGAIVIAVVELVNVAIAGVLAVLCTY